MTNRGWLVALCVVAGCGDDRARGPHDTSDGTDGADGGVADAPVDDTAVDSVGDTPPDAADDIADIAHIEDVEATAADTGGDTGVDASVAARVLTLPPELALRSIAIAPDGSRAYLGLSLAERRGRDIVWVVDPTRGDDVESATVARAIVATAPLDPGRRDSVSALTIDPVRRRLYAALSPLDGQGQSFTAPTTDLVAWELDAAWEPIDPPRVIDSGQPYHALESLSLSADGRFLYASGFGEAGVRLVPLDTDGWPSAPAEVFLFGGSGKRWSRAVGGHLWTGVYPGQLESVPLAPDGRPLVGDPSEPPPAACWAACDISDGYLDPLLVGDLLVRLTPEPYPFYTLGEAPRPPLEVRPLALEATRVPLSDTRATALATDGARLVWARETTFVDPTGAVTPNGAELVRASLVHGDDIALGPIERLADAPDRYVRWIAAPPSGPVLALAETRPLAEGRSYPSELTLTVDVRDAVDADGRTIADPAATLTDLHLIMLGASWPETPLITAGVPLPLEPLLRERDGAVLVSLGTYQPLDRFHVVVRVDDGGSNLATFDLDVVGSEVLFFLPGGRVRPEDRAARLESMDQRAERYRDWARAAAPDGTPRPDAFPVSCFHVLGGQGSRRQLDAEVEAVARLGCNVVTAYAWGRLPPSEVRAVLDRWGIPKVTGAVYMPPSYFAHDEALFTDQAMAVWIDDTLGADQRATGRAWGEYANLQIADEPGWYYPYETDRVIADPALLARFQSWVAALGEPAEAYGVASFDDLFPATGDERGTLADNRRFAATMRFFPAQAAAAFRRTREAIEAAAGREVFTSSNFNNLDLWTWPTPNVAYANNWDASERAGFGSLDWFGYARAGAANPWTEDWFPDRAAIDWSLPGDYLRRMAELGGRPFGIYLIGGMMGLVDDGPTMKLFALLGRGLKLVDLWTFGPEPLFPGNCWSDNQAAYGGIAKALARLAAIEDDVLPAVPDRGVVALLSPHASMLWDPVFVNHSPYRYEPSFLAPALAAANLDTDPLDDEDLGAGALATRGHRVLIVTAPNVAEAAQVAIADWVAAGGTLVLMPGAGVADELARPTDRFDHLAGVGARGDTRVEANPWGFGGNPLGTATLTATAAGLVGGLDATARRLVGPIAPLSAAAEHEVWARDGADGDAVDHGGGALVVVHAHGAGRVVSFGFWPGFELLQGRLTARYDRLMPLGDPAIRAYATLGPRLAGAGKRVTVDRDGVEAQVLESDRSLVVFLLNWTGTAIADLTVTVDDGGRRSDVRALEASSTGARRVGDALVVHLPIGNAEVLVLE